MAAITSLVQTAIHHSGSSQENLHMLKTLATRASWIALSTLALLPALILDTTDTLAILFEGDISLPWSQKLATWQKDFSNPDLKQIGALFTRTLLLLPVFAVDLSCALYQKILDWTQKNWEDFYVESPEFSFFVAANRAAMLHQSEEQRRVIRELLAGEGEMVKGDPPINIYHYVATLTLFHVVISGENALQSLREQIPSLPSLPSDQREQITRAIYNFSTQEPAASEFFSIGFRLTQNSAFMQMILSRKKQG